MPGIFRTSNPFSIIILFFYGLVLRYAAFLHPLIPEANPADGVLYHSLLNGLRNIGSGSPVIYPVIAWLLIFGQAIMLNTIFNRHRLLSRPTYLPALSYVLITALFPEWWELSSALIVNTLLIWAWSNLSDLYKNQRAKQLLFNAGIAIGLSSFFYFPSIGFILLMFAALLIMRPVSLPEWFISILGVTIPYYFLFAWLYLQGTLDMKKFLPTIHLSYPHFQQSIWAWVGLLLLVVPFLISGFFIQNAILRMLIQVRKNWSLLLVYLLIGLLVPFSNATHTFEYWILSAVPFAAFHSNVFFSPQKRLIPLVLHWSMAAFILVVNYLVLKSA